MSTLDSIEIDEWTESLDAVLRANGPEATSELLRYLSEHAEAARVPLPVRLPHLSETRYRPMTSAPCPATCLWNDEFARWFAERDGHGHAGQ